MSTIPQRLRTWADRIQADDHMEYTELAEEIRLAAAELESQEDAEHAAMYRFTRKMSADHGIDYMRRCDTEDQIDTAIRAAMKETK